MGSDFNRSTLPVLKQQPLQKMNITCPICKTQSQQLKLKPHLYTEQAYDIDMHPTQVKWAEIVAEKLNPALYSIWHCPSCHFASMQGNFEEPAAGYSISPGIFKKRVEAILLDHNREKPITDVIFRLSMGISDPARNYFSAVKLYLLAIFILQQITEVDKKDSINLARYCLRLGWLYREIASSRESIDTFLPQIENLISKLTINWPRIPGNESAALELAVNYYDTALSKSYSIKTVSDEVKTVLLMARIKLQLGNTPESLAFLQRAREKAAKNELAKMGRIDAAMTNGQAMYDVNADGEKAKQFIELFQKYLFEMKIIGFTQMVKEANNLLEKYIDTGIENDKLRNMLRKSGFAEKIVNIVVPI